jgi:hypothetical protein
MATSHPIKELQDMRRIAIATVLAVLSTQCHAQGMISPGQCEQVRGAIQQHGLEAARKHAMANHGLSRDDIRNIEQSCGIGQRREGRAKRQTTVQPGL